MPTAFIQLPLARIKLHSERLLVLAHPNRASRTPCSSRFLWQRLTLHRDRAGSDYLPGRWRPAAAKRGHSLSHRPRALAGFLPATNSAGWPARYLCQYRRAQDADFSLSIARRVVESKISQSDPRIAACPDQPRRPAIQCFVTIVRAAGPGGTGEGRAVAIGMRRRGGGGILSNLVGVSAVNFPIRNRSTRPPHNAVNACSSFGSTLVYHELVTRIYLAGWTQPWAISTPRRTTAVPLRWTSWNLFARR